MPGVSSMQPVSGMYGIGKIHLKFKPKPKRKFPFGALLFFTVAFLYILAFLSRMEWSRYHVVLPIVRAALLSYGVMRKVLIPKDLKVHGIRGTVSISEDAGGVAIVKANDMADALFGQGYLHASQHLFAMEMKRRTAMGTLAEIEGENALLSDRVARVFNFRLLAASDAESESVENLHLLKRYAAGVNEYITSMRLPTISMIMSGMFHVRQWSPEDILMLIRLDAFLSQSSNLKKKILNMTFYDGLGSDAAMEFMDALNPIVDELQSDSSMFLHASQETVWATGSSSSRSPLLAATLSTLDGSLNYWYINDISGGPDFHVVGASKPGIPFIYHGHNNDLSWSIALSDEASFESFTVEEVGLDGWSYKRHMSTEGNAEDLEGCVEDDHIDSSSHSCPPTGSDGDSDVSFGTCSSGRVAEDSKTVWCPFNFREEYISVRGHDQLEIEHVTEGLHGPVVTKVLFSNDRRFQDKVITLDSPLLNRRVSIEFLKALNVAATERSLVHATKEQHILSGRVIFATKSGAGYVALGNGRSLSVQKDLIVVGSSSGTAKRAYQLADAASEVTTKDLGLVSAHMSILCDSASSIGRLFANLLIGVLDGIVSSDGVAVDKEKSEEIFFARKMLERIKEMQKFEGDSGELVYLEVLILTMKKYILAPVHRDPDIYRLVLQNKRFSYLKGSISFSQMLNVDSLWLLRILSKKDSWWVRENGGLPKMLLKAIVESRQAIEKSIGPVSSWSWDSSHKAFFSHVIHIPFTPSGVEVSKAFELGPYAVPGTSSSIFQTTFEGSLEEQQFWSRHLSTQFSLSSTFRMVVPMDDLDSTSMVSANGQSTMIESYLYAAGAKKWAQCELNALPWSSHDRDMKLSSSSLVTFRPLA